MRDFFRYLKAWLRHYWNAAVVNLLFAKRRATAQVHSLPGELVVSLTSFPPRYPQLHLTLKCLLSQSLRVDRVVLWLARKDFESLPDTVKDLQEQGLTIGLLDEDLKSYNKLLPALAAYPAAFIATADDDLLYRHRWLEELVDTWTPGENVIPGHRGHRITRAADGRVQPYTDWPAQKQACAPDDLLLLTGVGGILYPPHCFDNEVFAAEKLSRLCPGADDIWFYFMLRRRGYHFKKIGPAFKVRNWIGSQKFALNKHNLGGSGNDQCIQRMMAAYPGIL